MSNEFEHNDKLLGLNGILNRRGFITNFFIIELIEALVFSTPLLYIIFLKPNFLKSFLSISTSTGNISTWPLWILLWMSFNAVIQLSLLYPSITRRLRDITGEAENNNHIILIMAILTMSYLANFTGFIVISQIFRCISFIIMISMMCIEGKISGEKPKDEIIKFNWGAMFGTWIWGLVNRAPKALFAIPLLFTTGFFPFMIICGLKGNKWAYKHTNKSVEEFHKNQVTQTAIFSALAPIFFIGGIVFMSIFAGVSLYTYLSSNPSGLKKLENYSSEMITTTVEAHYDKIDLSDDNEYKFYIDPVKWNSYPTNGKKNIFMSTENYVMLKKNITPEMTSKDKTIAFDLSNKIKIYSTFNNEILAQRNVDIEKYKETIDKFYKHEITFKEYAKIINSGYEINNNPTLP